MCVACAAVQAPVCGGGACSPSMLGQLLTVVVLPLCIMATLLRYRLFALVQDYVPVLNTKLF